MRARSPVAGAPLEFGNTLLERALGIRLIQAQALLQDADSLFETRRRSEFPALAPGFCESASAALLQDLGEGRACLRIGESICGAGEHIGELGLQLSGGQRPHGIAFLD
jgi:hypothetical protein